MALLNSAEVVDVKTELKIVKEDPKDDMVIVTALDGRADYIVTGDKHLLKLKSFRGITITTVEGVLKLL